MKFPQTVCPSCRGPHDQTLCLGWTCDCCAAIQAAPELLPFFTFYGGKYRAAKHYPGPRYSLIIEPFAGSAGFSVRHPGGYVWLNDLDPIIAGTWSYLTRVKPAEILALPDLEPGQTTDDLALPQEARWLIGWWLNKGSATPKKRASSFMLKHPAGAPYWGASIRERIARQLPAIRHWKVTNWKYESLPLDYPACWYVDPPYANGGQHYRYGRAGIDYAALGDWCSQLPGQVIVCEADDADWLPFRPLVAIDGNEGCQKKTPAKMESVYLR
jgi:hypothetical protein